MDDVALLQKFQRTGDPSAFADLVARYQNLVYSVCLRILEDRQEAEDAAQAVFVVFFRKASGIPKDTVLAGWLYRSAELTALHVRRTAQRRAKHEREAHEVRSTSRDRQNSTWENVSSELDAALSALPVQQRDAIILHYFMGRTQRDAAREVGCTEGAFGMRISRGLEALRARLAAQGCTLTSVTLAGWLV